MASSSSASDSENSSNSSGNSSSSREDEAPNPKLKEKQDKNRRAKSSDSSSSDESDSDDSGNSSGHSSSSSEDEAPGRKLKEKQQDKNNKAESSDSSSSDESGSSSSSSAIKASSSSSSSSASSDSSSDSDSPSDSLSVAPAPRNPIPPLPSTDACSPNTKPTKKRKIDENGAAITTATTTNGRSESLEKFGGGGKPGKAPRKPNERFQRIKAQEPTAEEPEFNNRYEVKSAPQNDYGARAHQDLIVTRGAGFRKEKNKKKRGSYRGGEITVSILSVCVSILMNFVWEYRRRVIVSNSRIDAKALGGNRIDWIILIDIRIPFGPQAKLSPIPTEKTIIIHAKLVVSPPSLRVSVVPNLDYNGILVGQKKKTRNIAFVA